MIRRLDLRGRTLRARDLRGVVPRAALDVEHAVERCGRLRGRRDRGVEALLDAHGAVRRRAADGTAGAGDGARRRRSSDLDPDVRAGLEESIRRARLVHREQVPRRRTSRTWSRAGPSPQRWVPVGRVGLYVPGGLAVYPRSVVMNVVPAQEAGVGSIAVASPPRARTRRFGGCRTPTILAACALLGVDEVYAVGGAQAVAMFAYGADGHRRGVCEPVDLVTGPGNIYVAAAKRLLKGVVGIDAEAGPTEIAVLADDTADPAHVAADLVSQAEHDPHGGRRARHRRADAGRRRRRPSSAPARRR